MIDRTTPPTDAEVDELIELVRAAIEALEERETVALEMRDRAMQESVTAQREIERLRKCPLDRLVIPHGGFRTIVADPPWKYGKWGRASDSPTARKKFPNGQWSQEFDLPYSHMSTDEIAALPVAQCAGEDCDLYLWTTQKYLPDVFKVLEAWGFKYCQTLTWCKTPRGTGQGGLFCPTTEFLILGRKGKMPKKQRVDSTWWNVKRTATHSTKPEFFQDLIESVSDDPRLELFARRPREGWTVWGNEV